jgi:hypothetical protein
MTNYDVHLLAEKLADDCTKAGLEAEVLAPTRVRVGAPGGHARLTDTVRCMPVPHGDESLMWWWSWGEPISPAAHIPDAVRVISRVLSLPTGTAMPGDGPRPHDTGTATPADDPHPHDTATATPADDPHPHDTGTSMPGDVPSPRCSGTARPAVPRRSRDDTR